MVKAIILAAGRGTRLHPMTKYRPKPLLKIHGKSLLEHQVSKLKKCGIDDITVIVGYKHRMITKIVDGGVNFVFNPFYKITNSIISLWLVRHKLLAGEDVIILNCDIFFSLQLMKNLINDKDTNISMTIDKDVPSDEADYKLLIIDGLVVAGGKKELTESSGEYVGITKVPKEMAKDFVKVMNELVCQEEIGIWYELTIMEMISRGFLINPFETKGEFWIEIDTIKELEEARKMDVKE